MGTQVTYAKNLAPIPSEYIEPYAQRFLMMQLESIAFGLITPQQGKDYIKGVEYFIGCFGGLHAQLATSNIYYSFLNTKDEDLIRIARHTFDI
jgi:hypothetical protein